MNIWEHGTPKKIMEGVIAWENCINVPDGVIDIMNSEVDTWKEKMTFENAAKENRLQGLYGNGPIRFNPEEHFYREESIAFFNHIRKNTLDKAAQYVQMYPDADEEIEWMETWQYITYTPPKNMTFHSDNHGPRNKETGKPFLTPGLRRFTALTYLNDDFKGGSLMYRYFDIPPYKAPAGTTLIQPSNYMWSHGTTPLLNGRKAAFLVAFNGYYNVEDEYLYQTDAEVLRARELR